MPANLFLFSPTTEIALTGVTKHLLVLREGTLKTCLDEFVITCLNYLPYRASKVSHLCHLAYRTNKATWQPTDSDSLVGNLFPAHPNTFPKSLGSFMYVSCSEIQGGWSHCWVFLYIFFLTVGGFLPYRFVCICSF